ncbi:cytochrome b-245 chaperone 1 isoform X1 [Trachypithecus francoisi]|uniref:cytochrome b-245 chaperone 1 isoform X1 n=1 Tax=Trachypithecus francoisi TaxID=54180 RepID=UPI00141B542C|nr:cytochrome b-245 chaperone 1 isoform X1 [Trachypithecus francoisi]
MGSALLSRSVPRIPAPLGPLRTGFASWTRLSAATCPALPVAGGLAAVPLQAPPPVEWCCRLGMYLQVETRTSSRLHLKRAPGIRSWSLLVGILSIGLAAAYYSGDSLGWKLFYVTGCLFVAVQNLEDWEEAIFDKSTGKVVLKTFSLYKKLLTLFRAGHDQVVVLLHDVRDVSVEEEKVRYFGKGYMVVLRLATGFSHPLTQSAVMGHRSDVEAIAKLITSFLELHCLESPTELSQSSDSEAGDPGSQS